MRSEAVCKSSEKVLGDGVHSREPKIAKVVISANLGRQALRGNAKIAKACVLKPFAKVAKKFAILGDGVRSGHPKIAKAKVAKIIPNLT